MDSSIEVAAASIAFDARDGVHADQLTVLAAHPDWGPRSSGGTSWQESVAVQQEGVMEQWMSTASQSQGRHSGSGRDDD